jgi:hypothetical protein
MKAVFILTLFVCGQVFADEPTDAEKQINFLKGISALCIWVDGVGKSETGHVYANVSKTAGAAVICSGTLQCKADQKYVTAVDRDFPGKYAPIVYYENISCVGEQLASGRVTCGQGKSDDERTMDCLRKSTGFSKFEIKKNKAETYYQASPQNSPVLPSNFQKAEVAR